jgi:hypothetical protein
MQGCFCGGEREISSPFGEFVGGYKTQAQARSLDFFAAVKQMITVSFLPFANVMHCGLSLATLLKSHLLLLLMEQRKNLLSLINRCQCHR